MNDIATIIVTYNGGKWIKKCLDSLYNSNYQTDIYIIDNGSEDQTVAIAESYPEIHLMKSKENLGFGKANNEWLVRLLPNSQYKYFFLLNQDAWVAPQCIGKLYECMEHNQEYGIISPLQYNKEFSQIDLNFSGYLNKASKTEPQDIINVPFVNAAVWLLSRNCLEKTGGFNPYFKHYGEDNNYCDRAAYKGFKIGIFPKARANHDREKTTDLDKIIRLSKIRLECLILNPNKKIKTNYKEAAKHILGIPKYYYKNLSLCQVIRLFNKLVFHYLKLIFSKDIKENYRKQTEGLFLT